MSISIRSRLLLLVLLVLVPAVAVAAWLIARTWDAERETLRRSLEDSTRALALVVDREFAHRAAIARVLANSGLLDAPGALQPAQLQQFEQLARRTLQGLSGWVELASGSVVLVDTRFSQAPTPRPRGDAPALVETPRVGGLQQGGGGEPHAAVVYPVQRNGRTEFNLTVAVVPAELQRIVEQHRLPAGWVVAVLDRNDAVVARHPAAGIQVGSAASADFRRAKAGREAGLFQASALDGRPVAGFFSTSPLGWTTVTAMPQDQYAGSVASAVSDLAIGTLLLLGLAVAGALWAARSIVRPVQTLKDAAARMQAGQPVLHRATGVREFDGVAVALAEAAEAMQHRRTDLERQVAQAVERTRATEQRISGIQRVEALGRLTGGVAHDFNNLLGVISNSAHLIQRDAGDRPELRAPVGAVLRAVDVGSRLTQHLQRFAGRHPARPARTDLARSLPEVLDLMKVVLGKRIEATMNVAPGTRAVVVDFNELELALINLALNARDALPSGGRVWVDARNAPAEDTAELPPGDYVLVTVSDDGVGIDEEVVDRVFEPFFTTKVATHGTGLGLSQVHGFCAQSGGRARVASTRGMGTTVSLVLPAAAESGDGDGDARTAAPRDRRLEGRQLLLVEDNEELANVTAMLLQSYGSSVDHARSAAEALQTIADGQRFDAVLSDVVMPGEIDGIGLARLLRTQQPRLPVVLISGYSSALASAQDLTVLRKPCAPDDLVAALSDAIAAARSIARPPGAAASTSPSDSS